jgi:ribosomal protein S27AE
VRETAWQTDESCPVCQTGLVLVDDGRATLRLECRQCGYVASLDTDDHAADGTW